MTVQTFFKGLFMVLISVAVTFFSQTPIQWVLLGVTVVSTILAYVGKNLVFVLDANTPSTTSFWITAAGGLLVAISTTLTESLALYLVEGKILWPILLKVVLGVTFTYVGSTFFAPSNSQSKKLFA